MTTATLLDRPGRVAFAVLVAAAATIGGAYVFQYGWGYEPCKLCLEQRIPYYAAMPVALVIAVLPASRRLAGAGLSLIAVTFVISAGMGLYHSGIEWGLWAGPADCAAIRADAASVGDFLTRLNRVRVVSCSDAAWRFLGLSLAGWNVVISLMLAAFAAAGAARALTRAA